MDSQNILCATLKRSGSWVVGNLCMSLTSLYPVLQRVDVETVDSLGRMVEDVVGAAVDSLPEEDTALIQQIIQAAGLTRINC